MTALAVVSRVGKRSRDGVHHGGGLVRVTRCPHRDQDDDHPNGELAPESASLVIVSPTGHSVSLRVGEHSELFARISRRPDKRHSHHALAVHARRIHGASNNGATTVQPATE